jgi:hypothetical protein
MFWRKTKTHRQPRVVVKTGSVGAALNDYTDFTVSGYGRPSAAIVLASNANTGANPVSTGIMTYSIGFWDGTAQTCEAIGSRAQDKLAGRFRRSVIAVASVVTTVTPTYTHYAEWTLSAVADGVRITMTLDNTTIARYFVVILFWGVNAKLYTEDFNGTTEKTYTPGFHPSLVFNSLIAGTDANSAIGHQGFGIARVSSSYAVTQYAASFAIKNGSLPSVNNQGINSTKFGQFYYDDGAFQSTCSIKSATATDFTVELSGSGSSPLLMLVIGLDNPDAAKLADYNTKTSTGTQAYTGVGFKPKALLTFNTGMTELDSFPSSATGCLGIAAASGAGEEGSLLVSATDNADPWSHSNRYHASALAGTSHSRYVLFDATLSSFDSDGFTLNYATANAAAHKFIGLSIG